MGFQTLVRDRVSCLIAYGRRLMTPFARAIPQHRQATPYKDRVDFSRRSE
jgi:hypothetical protein